jgi:hypothetical protein
MARSQADSGGPLPWPILDHALVWITLPVEGPAWPLVIQGPSVACRIYTYVQTRTNMVSAPRAEGRDRLLGLGRETTEGHHCPCRRRPQEGLT